MNGSKTDCPKVAILWRGDAEARRSATPQNSRFHRIFEELAAIGIDTEPAVYDEEFEDEVRAQLLATDGVLVFVNPLQDGRTRISLNALLSDLAAQGPWVSAHPDVISKTGTKQVLHRTRMMGWAGRRGAPADSQPSLPTERDAQSLLAEDPAFPRADATKADHQVRPERDPPGRDMQGPHLGYHRSWASR